MFKKLGLKGKLLAFSSMAAFFLVVVGSVGIYSLKSVIAKYHHIATTNLPNIETVGKMNSMPPRCGARF